MSFLEVCMLWVADVLSPVELKQLLCIYCHGNIKRKLHHPSNVLRVPNSCGDTTLQGDGQSPILSRLLSIQLQRKAQATRDPIGPFITFLSVWQPTPWCQMTVSPKPENPCPLNFVLLIPTQNMLFLLALHGINTMTTKFSKKRAPTSVYVYALFKPAVHTNIWNSVVTSRGSQNEKETSSEKWQSRKW